MCTYSLKGESPLIIEFDDDEIFVAANTKKYVYGSVTVPKNITGPISFDTQGFMIFEENFCVSCKMVEGTGGASVQINTCDLPIRVKVVYERSKENMYIPSKPLPDPKLPPIIGAIIIIIIIALAIIIYRKRKSQ